MAVSISGSSDTLRLKPSGGLMRSNSGIFVTPHARECMESFSGNQMERREKLCSVLRIPQNNAGLLDEVNTVAKKLGIFII